MYTTCSYRLPVPIKLYIVNNISPAGTWLGGHAPGQHARLGRPADAPVHSAGPGHARVHTARHAPVHTARHAPVLPAWHAPVHTAGCARHAPIWRDATAGHHAGEHNSLKPSKLHLTVDLFPQRAEDFKCSYYLAVAPYWTEHSSPRVGWHLSRAGWASRTATLGCLHRCGSTEHTVCYCMIQAYQLNKQKLDGVGPVDNRPSTD